MCWDRPSSSSIASCDALAERMGGRQPDHRCRARQSSTAWTAATGRRRRRGDPDHSGPAPGRRWPITPPLSWPPRSSSGASSATARRTRGPSWPVAGRLFAGLTGGSFVGFQIDDDGAGAPCSKGSGPTAGWSAVEGMSNGSHTTSSTWRSAGQPRILAPGARADPVRRRRHPPELRRQRRALAALAPSPNCRSTPRSSSSPTTGTWSSWPRRTCRQRVVRARASGGDGGGNGRRSGSDDGCQREI